MLICGGTIVLCASFSRKRAGVKALEKEQMQMVFIYGIQKDAFGLRDHCLKEIL